MNPWNSPESQSEALEPLDERFWLLSLYLDGEATPAERSQVEAWIDGDREFAQLYRQQRRLQQNLVDMPIPATDAAAFLTTLNHRLDQHDRRRWGLPVAAALTLMAGWMAVVALPRPPKVQLAQPLPAPEERLILAMEQPLVPAPKHTYDR
ncbi:MAG TPA: Fis family transcriptional regulator [Cyanobacteria bacterium UBA8156]|jgi:ferric-dicitrate binding protein FerR (iron transport regulator)|nr:Fis family transcriptional regulator [Cyanobacteria bacterium UBA8156]